MSLAATISNDHDLKASNHKRIYSDFVREVVELGLLQAHDRSFYTHSGIVMAFLAVGAWLAVAAISGWEIALALGIFAGVISGWVGMLGHDAGHGQAPKHSKKMRRFSQLFLGNVLLGFSSAWWVNKHTSHHVNPNLIGKDPDIILPLPLDAELARQKGLDSTDFRVRNAWWIFWLLLPLQAMNARISSVRYVFAGNLPNREIAVQVATIAVHVALYCALLTMIVMSGGWLAAVVFVALHQGTHGLYNSLAFATNHKGMPMYVSEDTATWLELQILTSRNVRSGTGVREVILTWIFGGLNYQIEHHLFPTMPRCRLKEVRPLVRRFCARNGFDYYETGVIRSYKEVALNFRKVAYELIDSPMGA